MLEIILEKDINLGQFFWGTLYIYIYIFGTFRTNLMLLNKLTIFCYKNKL